MSSRPAGPHNGTLYNILLWMYKATPPPCLFLSSLGIEYVIVSLSPKQPCLNKTYDYIWFIIWTQSSKFAKLGQHALTIKVHSRELSYCQEVQEHGGEIEIGAEVDQSCHPACRINGVHCDSKKKIFRLISGDVNSLLCGRRWIGRWQWQGGRKWDRVGGPPSDCSGGSFLNMGHSSSLHDVWLKHVPISAVHCKNKLVVLTTECMVTMVADKLKRQWQWPSVKDSLQMHFIVAVKNLQPGERSMDVMRVFSVLGCKMNWAAVPWVVICN